LGDGELGEPAEDVLEDDFGFEGVSGMDHVLELELDDLREDEVARGVGREGRGPEGAGGLGGGLDEEDAGHEGLAGEVVGEEGEAGFEALPAAACPAGLGDFEGVEEGEAGAVGGEAHGVIWLKGLKNGRRIGRIALLALGAPLAGGELGDLAEGAVEAGEGGEANLSGDDEDFFAGGVEAGGGHADAEFGEVLVRGLAEGAAKEAAEMGRAEVALPRPVVDGEALGIFRGHEVEGGSDAVEGAVKANGADRAGGRGTGAPGAEALEADHEAEDEALDRDLAAAAIFAQLVDDLAHENAGEGVGPRADDVAERFSGEMADAEKIELAGADLEEADRVEIKPRPLALRAGHAAGQVEFGRGDEGDVAGAEGENFFADDEDARALVTVAELEAIVAVEVGDGSVALGKKAVDDERKIVRQWNGGISDPIRTRWSFLLGIGLRTRRHRQKRSHHGGMNSIPYVAGWEHGAPLLGHEAKQLVEEGRDPKWIEDFLARREGLSDAEVWAGLQVAPVLRDFPFHEPSDLEGIRRERGPGIGRRPLGYSDEVLMDRMLGAWLGRCCGCALGKPVECFMGPANGLSSRERIRVYLEGVEEYPLRDYFPLVSPAQERTGKSICPASCREKIAFMESDDDIRYTVIGQLVLRKKGAGFTTHDVMQTWLGTLTYHQVCTAETQAYRNYLLRYKVRTAPDGEADWAWVATHQNPYREWIGAQIRADSWGYAAPGDPALAAEFAWRDARMSHVKNGIYGEMFVAAMIAAGYVLDDPLAVVEAGLAEIPQRSRLYRDMRETIELCRRHGFKAEAFERVLDGIEERLGHYSAVHTNNNAALVVAALLLGGSDFEKVITIAVMGGWDSDCNGATAGSIWGAMFGAEKIPARWKEPLHDTLFSEMTGYHPISIRECARRSFEIAGKVAEGRMTD
jgi:ADP-ribosylglycohydrolase